MVTVMIGSQRGVFCFTVAGSWDRLRMVDGCVPFQSKLEDGRFIGPFNPILFSPAISSSFLELQETEQKNTSLNQRVRQVVILAVGAVWKSNYELYAHSAAARKAGISEDAIRALTTGGLPEELSDQEKIAQRYVW